MKSRTSFFNLTVFRKDITRFAPAWGLYLVGMLMLVPSFADGVGYSMGGIAYFGRTIGVLSVVNILYAFVCAALLFGDLFNARLCNALHAMPMRREGWFLTHLASGMLFSVVPNLVVGLCLMPKLDAYWYVSLIWVGGMTATYLFFFGAAALAALCTGSRFAMALVYGLINFLSILILWTVRYIYEPLLFGIEIDADPFIYFSPVSYLCLRQLDFLPFVKITDVVPYQPGPSGWPYVLGIAAVGLLMLAGALLAYRKRHLEGAGDFITVRALSPVFLVLYTLAAGLVMYLFFSLFTAGSTEYLFLAVGIAVGVVTGSMLLKRTVRVFKPATFVGLAVMLAVIFVSMGLAKLDVLGIVRWLPEEDQIISASAGYAFDSRHYTTRDEAEIRELLDIHGRIIDAREEEEPLFGTKVYIQYHLKDGTTVARRYVADYSRQEGEDLGRWLSKPGCVLQTDAPELYRDTVKYINVQFYADPTGRVLFEEEARSLLKAVIADCEAGNMNQDWNYHNRQSEYEQEPWCYLEMELPDHRDLVVTVWPTAEHTMAWLNARGVEPDPAGE